MTRRDHAEGGVWSRNVRFGVMLVLAVSLSACAGEPPKAPPQTTPQAVRSNADRAFDKLKQEERERGGENQGVSR